ncbi:MAG: xanthine dehydrogenase family protein subunit M [Bdellovibrionales bacterium]|jgi:CO/xanthine dehydrogenase FAD-binding subunit|nr:xanthine dehydrogenase family protein subunit M [Bdellovibrionales bacterium]MBT3526804.1 xanthine dehydrogenase family protein subunit M [Bdellovibrionales bacterium]MBT7766295.1 xanthine dehydrogenase family protein subunit M [Bdellovibrionales bacterium]
MTITHQFDYIKAKSVAHACKLLSKKGDHRLLSGGTDLIGHIKENLATPDSLIDLKGIDALKHLSVTPSTIKIGALCTFSDLLNSKEMAKYFPAVQEMAQTVASVAVRNRATVVGNICSAVPSLDSAPLLLTYDAVVCVVSSKGVRKVPINQWFISSRQSAIRKGELVCAIEIKMPAQKHGATFVKLGRYRGEDLAQASVAVVALPRDRYRIAFGAVAPTPFRADQLEKLLNGKQLTDNLVGQAVTLIPSLVSPITDIRATKEYRTHMCQVMFERAVETAVARLR